MNALPKVIIIGAGAAGIAAATRLMQNGVTDLIILEAENRIGGRINSVEFGGTTIDLGAQWCHGEKNNIVYELSKDLDVLGSSVQNYKSYDFYECDSTKLDRSLTDIFLQIFGEIWVDKAGAEKFNGTFGDFVIKSYEELIDKKLPKDEHVRKIADSMLNTFQNMWMAFEGAPNWFQMSSKGFFQYEECEGDPHLHWKHRGYKTIFDILMKKIPNPNEKIPVEEKILLEKVVTNILWKNELSSKVTVSCSDNSSYECDHVICTVSIGALKTMIHSFTPNLPSKKIDTINAMELGSVHKIFLKFPSQWWPKNWNGITLLMSEKNKRDITKEVNNGMCKNGHNWIVDIFGFYQIDNHPEILLVWVVGSMIEEIERLSDEEVLNGCMYILNKFAGKQFHILQPEGIKRSFWKTNPHFNGCWSFRSIQEEIKHVTKEDLVLPLFNNKIPAVLFAGEATHPKFSAPVHGAIETGFREADRILQFWESEKLIHRKVAIIGAGMAGLAAATTLLRLGYRDFVLIEAQSKAGGRIQTLNNDGNILELGAQWIHGKDNPVYKLAREYGLLSEVVSEEGLGVYLRDNGEVIDADIVKIVDFEIGRILNECEKFVSEIDFPDSLGEFVERKFVEYINKCEDSDDVKRIKWELFDWHVRFQVIDNSCMNLKCLSAKGWGQYECIDDKAHSNLNCGFDHFIQILLDKLPENSVFFSTPVSTIQTASNKFQTNRILCENGSIISADYIIITQSLGVLKNFKIIPPLPDATFSSIQNLGFGAIGKIFLTFEYKWWTEDGFQFIWRQNANLDDEISWIKYITGFDPIVHGPNTLLGWVGAEGVKVMETLSENDIGLHCMILLRRFIPDQTIPEPVKVVRTTWLSNPYVLGGYSHITPDCDRSDTGMHKLSEPIFVDGRPRILIAGEAAHPSHYSTIHGAFESGQQQAKVLAEYMREEA